MRVLQRYESRDRKKSTLYGICSLLSINSTCLGCNGTDVFHVFSKNIAIHRTHMLCWISPGQKPFVVWATTWYEIVLEMLKPIKYTWTCPFLQTHPFEVFRMLLFRYKQLERQQTPWWAVKGYEGVLIWEEMKGEADCGASPVLKWKTK